MPRRLAAEPVRLGARSRRSRQASRVVSLIASSTEIVCALGCEGRLVGRSHECDFPDSVKRIPACTEPTLDSSGSSAAIDRQVRTILQDGLSVYRVDAELLKRLKPDVIITQSQCEVCAVSLELVERTVCEWVGSRPRLVSLEPNRLSDVWQDIQRVAGALGVPQRGEVLVRRLKQRMRAVSRRARSAPTRPTVACLEWIEPLMAAGNWMPELVELAGGCSLFGVAGRHSPWVSWGELCRRDPDVLILMPCGFDLARTRREARPLAQLPGWTKLSAVRQQRVYLTDGNRYFNRPGPRLVESLEILSEVLHPELDEGAHRGTGWDVWDDADAR